MDSVSGGAILATVHIVSSIVNSVTSTVNSSKARKQQEKMAAQSMEFQREMEANRQNFNLEMNEINAQRQREVNQQAHIYRLEEQNHSFENALKSAEWNQFLQRWPLVNPPSVIREQQLLPDDTVSLRVIFAKSADCDFHKYVYDYVEQGLRDFTDLYHNVFGSQNIIFYHNAFLSNNYGGAVESNIHYGLKELPVIIIGTNILMNQIDVSLTMWGLGDSRSFPDHMSIFKMPYQRVQDLNYYQQIASRILQYLKFIVGYAYDTYNLIEYNRMPLLPAVAQYEVECNFPDAILAAEELKSIVGKKYNEIYAGVIGSNSALGLPKDNYMLPCNSKSMNLHVLRLDYAKSVQNWADAQTYINYLDESVEAWVFLRSKLSVSAFLEKLISGELSLIQYCSEEDKKYFVRLDNEFQATGTTGRYGALCHEIKIKLNNISFDSMVLPKVLLPSKSVPANTGFIDL